MASENRPALWGIMVWICFLQFHVCRTEESNLAYNSQCSVNTVVVACAAAQWTEGGGPLAVSIRGKSLFLKSEVSCGITPFPINNDDMDIPSLVAIVPRGHCSFAAKALTVQTLGFAALLIIDNEKSEITDKQAIQPTPPGLGEDSKSVLIPVVMMDPADWNKHLSSTKNSKSLNIEINFTRPQEADLWLSSPWYDKPKNTRSLSLTSHGQRFTLRCEKSSIDEISDDKWLFEQWIDELSSEQSIENPIGASKGCMEIRNIKPSHRITSGALTSQHIDQFALDYFKKEHNGDEKKSSSLTGVVLFRLPHYDSSDEAMKDITVIDGLQASTAPFLTKESLSLLQGLNSNSHRFPWGGSNKYPRLFESGVLVLESSCVMRDGVIIQHRSPPTTGSSTSSLRDDAVAEYHYGGCGCCPCGHGELGSTFSKEEETINSRHDKVIVLIQRFHHGRLLQVMPLLQDEAYKVLIDTSNKFVLEVLIDVLGLKPSQIIPHTKSVSICASLLIVPAPIPCGHMPKQITVALKKLYTKRLLATSTEYKYIHHHMGSTKSDHQGKLNMSTVIHYIDNEVKVLKSYSSEVPDEGTEALDSSSFLSSSSSAGSELRRHTVSAEAEKGNACIPAEITHVLLREHIPLMLILKRLGTRSVKNHDEMFQVLSRTFSRSDQTPQGFQVVEFEASQYSVTCQAVWLQATSVLIAPHGSGLSNAIFLPDQSPSIFSVLMNSTENKLLSEAAPRERTLPLVVELLPWEYPNLTFYLSFAWLPLRHVVCTVLGGAYGAMEVDVTVLVNSLKELLPT